MSEFDTAVRWLRMGVFRDVFPWIDEELKAIAGVDCENEPMTPEDRSAFNDAHADFMHGTHATNPKIYWLYLKTLHRWKGITRMPGLTSEPEWMAAATACGQDATSPLTFDDHKRIAAAITSVARHSVQLYQFWESHPPGSVKLESSTTEPEGNQ